MSVLFAELSGPVGMGRRLDPEDLRQVVGEALAGVIAEVEGLGGTVTSVSGAGLVGRLRRSRGPRGRPRAGRPGRGPHTVGDRHRWPRPWPGSALGPCRDRDRAGGGRASRGRGRLRGGGGGGGRGRRRCSRRPRRARSWSARSLVPPPRELSSGGRPKRWSPPRGPSRSSPLTWSGPRRGPPATAANAGWRAAPPWSAAKRSWPCSTKPCGRPLSGTGSVVFVVGEPGLGKTRLVQECRKRFMAWVGAGTGRLPLWLEGRCASYASSTPYGLYQQLLSAWVGVAPEEGEEVVRPALERAMKAIFGGQVDHVGLPGPHDGPTRRPRRGPTGPAQPRRAPAGDLRRRPGRGGTAGRQRADRAGPGGPALGRPHIAAAHRGTGGTGR